MTRLRSAGLLAAATLLPVPAGAGPDASPRPEARAAAALTTELRPAIAVFLPGTSLRPRHRPADLVTVATENRMPVPAAKDAAFRDWIGGFRARARAQGIRDDVFDAAFRGVRYDAAIIERDRNQSEFTKTIWDYLDSAVSETRIRNGRAALERHGATLARIEARYGVEKEVVAAIWGLESAYGTFRGETDVIEAMATLAFDGRRGAFFEEQLVAALKILQSGDTTARNMRGSWAGAMGHTQFMPTSYLAHAEDFDGDGRREIWGEDPTDALASTAAYLKHFGWVKGMPWGVEVQLPQGFDYRLADREILKMPSDWARRGVVGMDGRPVRDFGAASVLLPAGSKGAAFLIFKNFEVLERYNTADAYVIGVGHLSDRLRGGPPFRGGWPRGDRALTYDERKEMQRRLTRAGFDTQGIDGRIGPLTIAAVRAFQQSRGIVPDGYASLALLERLR
ncbi:lytic murein transglycosylase [Rhodosalinus sp. FB01]|uniref:lytic murein transglycosylase n=1 Tax=Rhodosalinus sp. FB01 TaxID=3239194 RepID=UPI00352383A5